MAIAKNVSLENGLILNDVYLRIESIVGNKNIISINLYGYINQMSFLEGKTPVVEKVYNFTPLLDSPINFIKQGYDYLKTLPEYASAIDC